jgi:hypothetical protein
MILPASFALALQIFVKFFLYNNIYGADVKTEDPASPKGFAGQADDRFEHTGDKAEVIDTGIRSSKDRTSFSDLLLE